MQALAGDQLLVNDASGERTPKHQRICDKCCKLQEELEKKLDEDTKLLLTDLVNAIYDEEYQEIVGSFDRGYSLGVLTTMEVFEHYNSFFGKGGEG